MGWKFPPQGCGCCCTYLASDGNEYTDNFSAFSGWTAGGAGTWSVSGGRLRCTHSTQDYLYRNVNIGSMTDLDVIVEVDIFELASNTDQIGVFFDWSGSNPVYGLAASYTGSPAQYIITGVTEVASKPTPADGDKLTIRIQDASAGRVRVCMFVNEVVIGSDTLTDSWSGNVQYGVFGGPKVAGAFGEWDDFTIHKGNP